MSVVFFFINENYFPHLPRPRDRCFALFLYVCSVVLSPPSFLLLIYYHSGCHCLLATRGLRAQFCSVSAWVLSRFCVDSMRITGFSKSPAGVSVSVDGCLSLHGSMMNQRLIPAGIHFRIPPVILSAELIVAILLLDRKSMCIL